MKSCVKYIGNTNKFEKILDDRKAQYTKDKFENSCKLAFRRDNNNTSLNEKK